MHTNCLIKMLSEKFTYGGFVFSYFMSRDIQTVAESSCPSIDRKVVNSGKRLRAHMGIDEGNVCKNLFITEMKKSGLIL